MAAPSTPLRDLKAAVAAVKRCSGNQTHAAADIGIGREAMVARLRRAKLRGLKIPNRASVRVSAEEKQQRRRAEVAEAALDRARSAGRRVRSVKPIVKRSGREDTLRVIWPDLHGSQQDPTAVAAFLADVKSLDPDEGVGLGDIFDAGGFLAEHHVWGYVAETSYSFEDDVRAANLFLDGYQKAAPRSSVALLEGNHEGRVEHWCVTQGLRRGVTASYFMDKFAPSKLLETERRGFSWHRRAEAYDGLGVMGAIRRGKCIFTHAADLRSFSRYGANVVHGHDHQMTAQMFSSLSEGTQGIWSMGCLSRKHQYWHHDRPMNWTHGYGIQIVARSGLFLTFQIPIVNGVSLLPTIKLR